LVLVAMLRSAHENTVINPFTSPEAKPYQNHKDINAMTTLIRAYEGNDIDSFERTLRRNKQQIEGDEFMSGYIKELYRSIRMKVLLNRIKPYKRVGLPFLAKVLHVTVDLVENLCAELILDDKLDASIDQIHSLLNLSSRHSNPSVKIRYEALVNWTTQIQKVHNTVVGKIDGH